MMVGFLQKIAGDKGGNATIDFAFLLPIMLMLFVGVVEVTNLLRLDRKVVAAAQTAADLISQRRDVSNAQLNDILRASELVLDPYPAAAHSVAIVGIRFDEDTGAPQVDWQESKNGGTIPDALALAQNMGGPGEGIVIVRLTYSYSPIFFDFIFGVTDIEETSIMRPRRSTFVEGPGP
ncbi:TadE/TadG family type IV pilus assembly protein [Pelagibius sp.]|uniref:TadE/TadG family type IV pilus assembly protein n=1 Tax=Pelagibius sp. TaxID=1931238 RepID=UPI003BB179A9